MLNDIMKAEMSIANRINYTKQNLSSLNIGDVIEIIRGGKKLLHDYEWGIISYDKPLNSYSAIQVKDKN